MPSPVQVRDWHELDVVSKDGEPAGKLVDVYANSQNGESGFLLISSGVLGHQLHLAPADGATRSADQVRVPVSKSAIDAAPKVHADDDLSPDEERRLCDQ